MGAEPVNGLITGHSQTGVMLIYQLRGIGSAVKHSLHVVSSLLLVGQ